MSLPVASAASQPVPKTTGPVPAHKALNAADAAAMKKENEKGFSFLDFLDIVNPLQHIPIVGTIYRELTGDDLKGSARVIGGALFGGPAGAILGGVNALVAAEHNGKDLGELAMNKIGLGSKDETQLAENDEKMPMVEVHPSDAETVALPIDEMPFARISANEIVWDETGEVSVASNESSLPQAKGLNDLKPVAGLEPKFDPAFDEASSVKTAEKSSSSVPVAPADPNQVPDLMMQAMAKYQAMQGIGDKTASIPPIDPETGLKTRRPFAGLADVRHYAGN